MEELKKKPDHYAETDDSVMSNFDNEIDYKIGEQLKSEELYSQYAGWNFCGYVWWDKKDDVYRCEVWQYRCHVSTFEGDTLKEIMEDVSLAYGYD